MSNVTIQVQFPNNQWVTVKQVLLINDQNTISEMQQAQTSYNGARVRAVDGQGRLLDMLA
jgi:hypothetical protein